VGDNGVERREENVGKVMGGRSNVMAPLELQLALTQENVAMEVSQHAQLTHVQQSPNLRSWKRSARRGGVLLPQTENGSIKKRKVSTSEGIGEMKGKVKWGRCGDHVEREEIHVMAEAEVQPHHPL
jgi:hypothetical protein